MGCTDVWYCLVLVSLSLESALYIGTLFLMYKRFLLQKSVHNIIFIHLKFLLVSKFNVICFELHLASAYLANLKLYVNSLKDSSLLFI